MLMLMLMLLLVLMLVLVLVLVLWSLGTCMRGSRAQHDGVSARLQGHLCKQEKFELLPHQRAQGGVRCLRACSRCSMGRTD